MDSEILVETAEARGGKRPPPKAVTLLLPVWGYRFVSQFLEFCLPTLLAPGNLPAVAAALPTRFVILSREDDEELIHSHPAWPALRQVCDAEVQFVDDLITDGNHTTTITLAFARAVRQSQEAMTDTCFVFLMSDYLFADGCLRTLVRHFLDGASAIVAGNFQIIAEEASESLPYTADPASHALVLPGRDLLAWSLSYLHPATTANIVNFRLSHNSHTNRLLWRVDENTLIGRFYLIHPIGIRPEVTDFVVGSSLDYSFIPEMCPSGNVVTLTDSDDYFIVEMQPRRHESANLRMGPIDEGELAVSLTEWTTVQHRANVAHTIVYHAKEIPPNLPQTIAEADEFISRISASLAATPPQPYRNHPYWAGAIASNRLRTGQVLNKEDWRFLLGEAVPRAGLRSLLWRTRLWFFGAPPDVTRFHTRWPDYNLAREALRQVVSDNGRLLLVTDRPHGFAQWLTSMTTDIRTLEWDRLVPRRFSRGTSEMPEWYRRLLGSFEACLLVVTEPMLLTAGAALDRLSPLLKETGQIFIMILNDRPYYNALAFKDVFALTALDLVDVSSWTLEVRYVPATRMRWLVYRSFERALHYVRDAYLNSSAMLPIWGAFLVLPSLATGFVNFGIRAKASPPQGLWSSVFLRLQRARRFGDRERNDAAAHAWAAAETVELNQKSASVSDQGESILAAHNVAAKLLAGERDVAIYGLDDGDIARLARYDVRQLTVYDPGFVDAKGHRDRADTELREIGFHDILNGPLLVLHNAICSFSTLIYVSRADEDIYVGNLAASLIRNESILILGCPSSATAGEIAVARDERFWMLAGEPVAEVEKRVDTFESIDWGREVLRKVSQRKQLYPRTGLQLKAMAERYFENVLLFSIVCGVLYPGDLRASDYNIAVCCSRKTVI
jgi:hypothetical protein